MHKCHIKAFKEWLGTQQLSTNFYIPMDWIREMMEEETQLNQNNWDPFSIAYWTKDMEWIKESVCLECNETNNYVTDILLRNKHITEEIMNNNKEFKWIYKNKHNPTLDYVLKYISGS